MDDTQRVLGELAGKMDLVIASLRDLQSDHKAGRATVEDRLDQIEHRQQWHRGALAILTGLLSFVGFDGLGKLFH